MFVALNSGERHQIVDQARHTVSLNRHDRQEPFARALVLAGMAPQGFNKACQRRQGRAQFVAGIGHEIGPHPLGASHLGLVLHHHQAQAALCGLTSRGQGGGHNPPEPVLGPARIIGDGSAKIAEQGRVNRFQHFGPTNGRQ